MASNAIFFHAGPGLNPEAERQLIGGTLRSAGVNVAFWEEPSRLRPEGRFPAGGGWKTYIASAEAYLLEQTENGPAALIGHSFGAQAALRLASSHRDRVSGVVLIAPTLDLVMADRLMLGVARRDFEADGDSRGEELAELIERVDPTYDESAARAFQLALGDAKLFDSYFCDKEAASEYLSKMFAPGYGLDFDEYMEVRRSIDFTPPAPVEQPLLAIFGDSDPILPLQATLQMLRSIAGRPTVVEYANAGHCPHVEHRARFAADVREFLSAIRSNSLTAAGDGR